MRTFCVLSGIILGLVFPILFLDYIVDNGFLQKFMQEESLSIMGNMLAIYVGVVTAFAAILDQMQNNLGIKCINTQRNLKKNIVEMLIIYGLQIICFVITPERYNDILWVEYVLKGFEVLLFILYFLMFYEVLDVFFTIRHLIQNSESDIHSK